ncbi:flagellar biosynthetic protein FliO [Photobacterium damselae]|uniref:flagellar biosynthetic protein FliO n=1 Tax=Photobacterium damselae TaxID=38293 RepID=UPI00083AB9D9|nr:flagellar biosynthetic protein FliO [Photobacterium damselae]KAB1509902.1 flagellar biosynthetic protein FliO [Photobacterium damselae subsp. damselae]ODA25979.1 flagellar biosynthetic protein FliO [Photobacterium damselae subsp. damselae]TLS69438.1 flagellar biosynthetic protein FliO [Photobacterium damselae subsp. damselae]
MNTTPDLNIATTLASLLLVIGLIFLLAWLVKRMRVTGFKGRQQELQIISQLAVGTKERIALVQVGQEQVLVGITAHNISLLTKLEHPVTLDKAAESDFASQLNAFLNKHDKS